MSLRSEGTWGTDMVPHQGNGNLGTAVGALDGRQET